jgi:hypothetical protein
VSELAAFAIRFPNRAFLRAALLTGYRDVHVQPPTDLWGTESLTLIPHLRR